VTDAEVEEEFWELVRMYYSAPAPDPAR